jgi:hypothetical protein
MTTTLKQSLFFTTCMLFVIFTNSFGQAPYRVATAYEDTVRIAIIWNDAQGNVCENAALHQPVGEKTRNFVIKALDTTQVNNVRVLLNSQTRQVSWTDIQALWPNRLPHVIVHVNAGWSTGWNTATLQNTFDQAVNNHVGIVSVGDDAANLSQQTFGFTNVENVPAPLGDGTSIDSLWIGLIRANDDRLKVYDNNNQLAYPYVNGIISNAVDRIFPSQRQIVQFKPRNNGRCQADADRYTPMYSNWLTMLGYQRGYIGGSAQPDINNQLNVLVAIQDTTPALIIRRAVAVSFQPQFLRDSVGVQQIVYDAIMFASLAHTLSVPTLLRINTDDDTITAGEIDTLLAYVIDQRGDTIHDPTTTVQIQWGIRNAHTGDRYIGNNYGDSVRFTATEAHRFVTIYAQLNGPNGLITDSARIWIRPGPADHLVIEGSSTPRNYLDDPIGGNSSVTIGSAQTEARGYAVLRDRYQNLVLPPYFSTNTQWDTLRPNGIITARNGTATIGEGILTKTGPSGTTQVRALDRPSGFSDTITVRVDDVQYDSLKILQYDIVLGRLVRINSLTLPTSDSTVLYVQGLRRDRLGPPGSGGWVDVPGLWSLSTSLLRRTNPDPPSTGQNAWGFSPTDTGHGTITVRLPAGPQTSIPATFTTGAPRKVVLYPAYGNPVNMQPHPEPQVIADSVAAGRQYTRLYAKLFDENDYWLADYQNNTSLAQQIQWTFAPTTETTLSSTNGHSNTLRSTLAYTRVKVKATWNTISDSVIIYIKPDTASHMVIEASPTIRDLNNDDPLSSLVIRSEQTLGYVYAILRDSYGNFVGYSNPTKWNSLDVTIVTADTALTGVGEGIVNRVADRGLTKVIATDLTKNFKDTVDVELQNIFYKQLRIYLLDNGPKYIDSIRVRTDEKLSLYVEGQRSDNNNWERVDASWSKTASLKTVGNPPGSSYQWEIVPDSVGTGWIKVSLQSAIPDSVYATFLPGLPGSIGIYKQKGNPLAQRPYPTPPQIDTIIAGTKNPLVVAVFDRNGIWLNSYADSIPSLSLISWTIARVSGSDLVDTLDAKNGYLNSLTPTQAYTTYLVTATFNDGIRNLRSSVLFYVLPGPPHHLTIEGSSNITRAALYDDQPLNVIDYGARDTVKTAFAIIRDIFGNYVQYSTSTNWHSLDSLIATASEGVALVGEGKVIRIGSIGNTKVIAVNRLNTALFDTVDVNISSFSYDSLKIVVGDSTKITELVMPSDQDTLLKVLGLRSYDQKWVPVNGNWVYQSSNISLNQNNQNTWLFAPGDTTHGTITVTSGTAVPAKVNVWITPGSPDKLVLYPRRGAAGNANAYANPPDTIAVTAGSPFPLVSKIFDHKDVWLSDYETAPLSNTITWSILELSGNDSSGVLSKIQGDSVSFFPIRAYQRVYVVGKITTSSSVTYSDTALLSIVPGKPVKLFIESSAQVNLHHPVPVDTIRILGNMTNASGYAILRDSLGNFANYSQVTTWGIVNNDTSISIRNGITQIGEGIVDRNVRQATVKIWAMDALGFRDSTMVKLVEYYYTQLRILVQINPVLCPDSLTMPTTEDTTLLVQGLRSDTTQWEFVDNAIWQNSPSLKITPSASTGRLWRFSPTDTGSGFIRVTLNNDTLTKPDTLWVHFIPGPPSEIRVKILTPPAQRIAGEQIQLLVELFNEDGKVKGPWDFNSAKYTDILPDGGRPKPFVLIGSDTLFLGNTGKEKFIDGVDTVPLVLYYAPWNKDSLHQVTVTLDGLKAVTDRFELISGGLHHLQLERQEQYVSPVGDTLLVRTTDDLLQLVSIGYDIYGNRRGKENSNWDTDSTLHKITGTSQNTPQIVYYLSGIKDNEFGNIIAAATKNTTISTSVFIKLMGPAIKLKSSTTDDVNGDGYLDRLVLKFDRPVTIPVGTDPDFIIKYGSTYFDYDSIGMNASRTDSVLVIYLKKTIGDSSAQTGWKPVVNFDGNIELGLDSILNHTSIDGAGPVITRVTDKIVSSTDRKLDVVTVTLSEPIQRFDNVPLKATDIPSLLFYVWEKDPQGKMILKDSILAGIDNITFVNDTTITFIMTNGYVLSQWNYFSIKTAKAANGDTTSIITDKAMLNGLLNPNYPNSNNVQVKVLIIGDPDHELKIYPNPASADERHTAAGTFILRHDPQAYDYIAKDGGGGIIFSLTFMVPDRSENVKVKLKLKVYDAVGNQVITGEESDITSGDYKNNKLDFKAGINKIEIYWNLFKTDKIKIAPGMYKVIEYLEYYGSANASKYHDSRKSKLFGVHQRPPKNQR